MSHTGGSTYKTVSVMHMLNTLCILSSLTQKSVVILLSVWVLNSQYAAVHCNEIGGRTACKSQGVDCGTARKRGKQAYTTR